MIFLFLTGILNCIIVYRFYKNEKRNYKSCSYSSCVVVKLTPCSRKVLKGPWPASKMIFFKMGSCADTVVPAYTVMRQPTDGQLKITSRSIQSSAIDIPIRLQARGEVKTFSYDGQRVSRIPQTKKYRSTFSRKKQRRSKIDMIVRFCFVFLSLSTPACSTLTPFLRTVQNLTIYINVRVRVRARRVTEISGARVQCTKMCDLFLRSKAHSVCRGQKRSRLHISAFLTCCIVIAWGGGGEGSRNYSIYPTISRKIRLNLLRD